MSYRNFLTIAAIITVVYGLPLIFTPNQLFSLYDMEINAGGILIARLFGAVLLGFGALNWLSRSVSDARARQAVVIANLVGDAPGFVITLIDQINGTAGINALGWTTIAVYLFLVAGFAYFGFIAKEAPAATMLTGSRP